MSKAIRQLALPLETHRNHYLFSDYYLNEVLPRQPIWREVEAEAGEKLKAITELYDQVADALPHYNESQTEEHWIRPALNILGHVYEVQPSLPGALGTPDYAFFVDEPARQAATPTLGQAGYWETALAAGDAKRWDRPLDKRIVNEALDAFTNANPCYQIDYYLRRTGCAWGIVSNGRRWRLYHRESSFRLDVFYEVDLVQLIEQGDLAAFRYFHLFFRAAAFHPDAGGRCWLDDVLAQSTAYAVRVGDELKGRVYEALRLLAQGFLDYPASPPQSPPRGGKDLDRVHDGCLILLYRLLFLLYAESRGLLPLDNASYARQYSLKAIKEEIAQKLDDGVLYLPKKATLWDDLRTLFDIIYNGQEALGVPTYDGRLFDPARYAFLEERTIGDRYLAQAIDLLARAEAEAGQGLSFVDYRDLSIRHLGSIYEGLLEYRLACAAEELAVVRRGKKGEEIVKTSEVSQTSKVSERIPAGQVYLITDRGERKATGSYYTPDYIVKYIVEQTLGPLADAQSEALAEEIAALKARSKGGARRTKAYKDELARLQNSFAGRVLALNVLDPAMGSGHFLVEATDYLARRIVESGIAANSLADGPDSDEESELSYWRRRVVERCIYGVDLNPLAVELAKLSLWLATVARGKPLSFLDHHLRCGNSLIGARVADLQALPVRKKRRKKQAEPLQLALWDESAFTQDMFRVVGAMRLIQEIETADLVSVKEKERLFDETVERERYKWRTIADLWTASYFGLELTPPLYNACVQYAQGQPVLLQAAQAEAVLAQARAVWEEKRFFHWEIEFPEVFFDEFGRHKGEGAGFDAVVGNPPYGTIEDRSLQQILSERKVYTCDNNWDNYSAFTGCGINLLGTTGQFGYIIPNTFPIGPWYEGFRRFVLNNASIKQIVNFGQIALFEDATVFCAILLLRKGVKQDNVVMLAQCDKFDEFISGEMPTERVPQSDLEGQIWIAKSPTMRHLDQVSRPLSEYCQCFDSGMDYNKKQVGQKMFYEGQQQHPNDNPYLRGSDIERYYLCFHDRWLRWNWKALLDKQRQERLKVNTKAYLDEEKIFTRQTGDTIIAALDRSQFYNQKSLHSTHLRMEHRGQYDLRFFLTILNSSVATYYYQQLSRHEVGKALAQIKIARLKQTPVPVIEFTTPPEERERLVEDVVERYYAYLEHGEDVSIRAFVTVRLMEEPEQADVVHDLLAHLAERMIEMHQAKQAEVRGFLDWLAGYTGLPVGDWVLKTKLRRYYEQDWAEMERVLKRNQRKLPRVALDVEAYKNEPSAQIRAAWETSMETLRPLLARIGATDRLIDCIVYRLYGLTEEDVAVVEGK